MNARLCFLGTSHAANHLREAASSRGFLISEQDDAPDVVFVSQDTPVREDGERNLAPIFELCKVARLRFAGPIVLTSQVPPGFTRGLKLGEIFHQAETLRIKDAAHRAAHPEMMIVGCPDPAAELPAAYAEYLYAFRCPVIRMTLEEAEFAKVAINMTLAAQVDSANRLAAAGAKVGVRWPVIADVLGHDQRIGWHSYLVPGRWQDSPHLLRDAVTLAEIEAR